MERQTGIPLSTFTFDDSPPPRDRLQEKWWLSLQIFLGMLKGDRIWGEREALGTVLAAGGRLTTAEGHVKIYLVSSKGEASTVICQVGQGRGRGGGVGLWNKRVRGRQVKVFRYSGMEIVDAWVGRWSRSERGQTLMDGKAGQEWSASPRMEIRQQEERVMRVK